MKGVALITGASGGIGKAIALRLSRDGFRVAINDIPSKERQLQDVATEIKTKGGEPLALVGDVTVEEQVAKMVDTATQTLGGFDVVSCSLVILSLIINAMLTCDPDIVPVKMVANAGIALLGPFLETTSQDFITTMNVNTLGVFHCYKHAAKQMIALGKGGRIIGASSLAGKEGLYNSAAYSPSKFAVRGLTQVAAREFARYNITVNGYAPGRYDH
ncbi:hypothetical protein CVT24_007226 [Panaeolus cyanescens]|uniref:NAD(P)-binding protein n=1 Tax=Panaeolus cyanescens TaxID=181874 RepID=A0A409WL91_9AGAR|nr:hypothetical protein CVT24_007226 [Panaeolus cyanescens]